MTTQLKRICFRLSAVFAVLAIFSTLFIPARAEFVDYNDYVYKVEVVGDQDLVYVKIPADMSSVRVYDRNDNYSTLYLEYGQSHVIPFKPGIDYRIEVSIFGNRHAGNGLDLSLIPPGTRIVSGLGFTFDSAVPPEDLAGMSVALPRVFYHYYEPDNQNYVHADTILLDSSNTSWSENIAFCVDTYTVQNIDNANRLSIAYFWQPVEWIADPVPTGITITDTTLVFTISSLLRQQQMTGKTNALLKEVELQLAEQGKTLDDIRNQNDTIIDQNDQIINGQVKPEAPDGSDRVDDLDDSEAGLRGDAQDGLDTGIEITQNALQIILQYATAFACVGWIFECFSTLPLFTALLFVSMALGIFGFVANIVQEVGAASREAKRRDQKHQNRKIIRQSRRK